MTDDQMVKHLLDPVTYSRLLALQQVWTEGLAKTGLPGVSLSHVLRSLAANGVKEQLLVYIERRKKTCKHEFGRYVSILDGPPMEQCRKCGTPKPKDEA